MLALSARWCAQVAWLASWLWSGVAAGTEPTPAHDPEGDGSGLMADVEPGPPSSAPQREEARRLYLQGSRHVEAGEWRLARSHYQRSFALHPSPSTLVNLALCETELGNDREARLLLERALALSASSGPRFDPARQAAVQAERERLEREIARAEGEAASQPLPSTAPVPPRPRETAARAEAGGARDRREPSPGGESAPLTRSVARPYRALGVGSLIGGGVAFTTALVSAAVLLDAGATLGRECDAEGVCPSELAGTVERYESAAIVTNVGLISGVAMSALGVVILVLDGRSSEANRALQASPSNVELRIRF